MKQSNRKPTRGINKREENFFERLDKTEFHPLVKNAVALFDSMGEFVKDSTPLAVAILIYIAVRLFLP